MQGDDGNPRYRVNQLTDTGATVHLALSEDIELESVSQQEMMLEAIDRAVTDREVKEQIRPIMEAILKSQPQTVMRSYPQTVIQITMPKKKYERIGSPRVGDTVEITVRKTN